MWTNRITLWCNSTGCDNSIDTGEPTVSSAREHAQTKGWSLKNATRGIDGFPAIDFCPDCAVKGFGSR